MERGARPFERPGRPAEPAAPAPGPTGKAAAGREVLYGYRAGLALLQRRADDVLEVVVAPALRHEVAVRPGVPVREADDRELERLAGSGHHEGLCVTMKPRRWLGPAELAAALVERRGCAVALDRVRNPYNIGAILRSAAFFGVQGAILGAPAPHPALAPDAVRVAEGGAEHLLLSRTTDLATTLAQLRARKVRVVGAESDGAVPLGQFVFERPTVLVVGNEREGLGERIRAQCDALVAIEGKGAIESLNVAVATGVMIAALTRG